jgi:serine/threonine protein kinase/sugar lactone lactonase YvrE
MEESSLKINLSHYRIISKLGVGGMGEVYLAEDTRLGRRVALKLLPESMTSNTDILRRFEQEARAASSLNHPNIAHIYEIGESEGVHYIAMEYVEGVSLDEKIAGRPLSVSKIVQIGAQIADALDEAHSQGITHRDIKSQNVMLTKRRRIKVLDFGLAKISKTTESAQSEAATQVKTNPGVVMGTVSYMSPEQALGRETDARTDIWSLGVVLYEMATGLLPFQGESITETIQQITRAHPEAMARFNYDVPPELEVIIKKALRKKREERYQSAQDILVDLQTLARELDLTEYSIAPNLRDASGENSAKIHTDEQATKTLIQTQTTDTTAPIHATSSAEYIATKIKDNKIKTIIVSAILLFVIPVLGYSLYRFVQIRTKQPEQTANQTAPSNLKIQRLTGNGKVSRAAISPDGKFLAYVQNEGGQQSLWVKQISTNSNVQVIAPALVEEYTYLAFTPDGSYIYFNGTNAENRSNTIFRVPTFGGSLSKVFSNTRGGSLSPDGKQIAFGRWDAKTAESALFVANTDGSGERKLASLFDNLYFSSGMAWSPDGKFIACGVGDDKKLERKQTLALIGVSDGASKELSEYKWDSIDSLAWLPDMSGIIFSADDTGGGEGVSKIFEISYPGGESRRLTQNLTDYSDVTITADGKTLVARESDFSAGVWVSPNAEISRAKQITTGKADYARGIAWTPDKRIVYIANTTGIEEVWIMNADGSNQKQLTNDARIKYTPVVSPDNRYIVYATPQGGEDLWRINIDGSSPTLLTGKPADEGNPDISPDGKWIVYTAWTFGKRAIWRIPIEGGAAQQLTNFEATEPHVSPDGKFIACFFSDEKNIWRIAIIPFEGGAPVKTFDVPPTVEVDMTPKWTPDAKGITYVDRRGGIGNLWLQPIDGGAPKQITDFKQNGIYRREWTPDGKQVAIVRGEGNSDAIMITDFR